MKILVVDDDTTVLDSCKRVLVAEGFEVYLVSNASRAIEIMDSTHFSLLLVDVKMPEHDGMWLIQKVKERYPKIPIIVMTGYPTPATIASGIKLGATSVIAKPFTPDEIIKLIRETYKKGGQDEGGQSSGH